MDKAIIVPVFVSGREGMHQFIPIENPWEEKEENEVELLIGESYYRLIGSDFNKPEAIDLDGGPFMHIGTIIWDYYTSEKYEIKEFDCLGKYPILKCNKLQSQTMCPEV